MTYQAKIGKLRLAGFVIVSACVHASLLVLHDAPQRLELGNARQDMISVSLQDASPRRVVQTAHHKTSPRPNRHQNAPDSSAAETRETQLTSSDRDTGSSSRSSRRAIVGRLRQDIARYFYYPPQALRRGWEGTVVVHLRLLPSGRIDRVRLGNGSGHEILDRAALRSVKHIQQLAMADLSLTSALEFQIPIIYRLRGG